MSSLAVMFWRDSNSASVLQTKSGSYGKKKKTKEKNPCLALWGRDDQNQDIYIYSEGMFAKTVIWKVFKGIGGNFVEMNRNQSSFWKSNPLQFCVEPNDFSSLSDIQIKTLPYSAKLSCKFWCFERREDRWSEKSQPSANHSLGAHYGYAETDGDTL